MGFSSSPARHYGAENRIIIQFYRDNHGYHSCNVAKEAEIRAGSPLAYPESGKQSSNIASTLIDAIALIGDPALGGVDAERRATMLTHLRSALALVDGTQSIVDFEWQNIE